VHNHFLNVFIIKKSCPCGRLQQCHFKNRVSLKGIYVWGVNSKVTQQSNHYVWKGTSERMVRRCNDTVDKKRENSRVLKHLFLQRVEQPKILPKPPGNAFSDALLMSFFENFAGWRRHFTRVAHLPHPSSRKVCLRMGYALITLKLVLVSAFVNIFVSRESSGIFSDSSVPLAQWWRARDSTNVVIRRFKVQFRPKTCQLRFTWIWTNRPSRKGSKLVFPVKTANSMKTIDTFHFRDRHCKTQKLECCSIASAVMLAHM